MHIEHRFSELSRNRNLLVDLALSTRATDETDEIFIENDTGATPEEILGLFASRADQDSEFYRTWANLPENTDGDNIFQMPSFEEENDPALRPFMTFSERDYLSFPEDDRRFARLTGEFKNLHNEIRQEISEPNGEFSPYVRQGTSSDCWLLATLLSLRETSRGREILDEMIDVNPEGSATVHFRGSGDSYTIPPEDIESRDAGNKSLASGDPDYRAVERAMILHMQNLGDAPSRDYSTRHHQQEHLENPENPLGGGWMHDQITRDLVGSETDSTTDRNQDERTLSEENLDLYASALRAGTISGLYTASRKYADRMNEEGFILSRGFEPQQPANINLITNHGYAISEINPDSEEITIINPHNASREITLSYEEFLGVFNNIQVAHEVNDNSRRQTVGNIFRQTYVTEAAVEYLLNEMRQRSSD